MNSDAGGGILKREYDDFKQIENEMAKKLDTNTFFDILSDVFGYDYEYISKLIQGGLHTFYEQQELNIIFRMLKSDYNIPIYETLLFLEEENIMMSRLIKFIDDETEFELKQELSAKYNIDMGNNNIIELWA
ncbi:MAG: hypothetical protein DRQ24_10710 [Candidatus Latescibacterota bacterium]|nr:MAG: hypothetical protein DRQ24_10710 [Candidatus Latescibacterota bacterium]